MGLVVALIGILTIAALSPLRETDYPEAIVLAACVLALAALGAITWIYEEENESGEG